MENKKIISELAISIIVLIAIIIGGFFWWQNINNNQLRGCTMEAKICPDGSSVGRSGPSCEFAPCPTNNNKQIANPASVYCEQNGGKLEIRTAPDGGQTGYCKFNDGSECEEWAYFRKECGNEIVDYKKYINNTYKFSFQYPQNWKILENTHLNPNSDWLSVINVTNNDLLKSIDLDTPNRKASKDEIVYTVEIRKHIDLKHYQDSVHYVEFKKDNVDLFFVDDARNSRKDEFNKILSTFKFIDASANETANWQTYKNNKYGFEFKYPKDWNVKNVSPSDAGGDWLSVSYNNLNPVEYHIAVFKYGSGIYKGYDNNTDPKKMYEELEGIGKTNEEAMLTVDGYPAYYGKEVLDSYTDDIYLIAGKNIILYIVFRERENLSRVQGYSNTSGYDYSYGEYLLNFKQLVSSIKFIN